MITKRTSFEASNDEQPNEGSDSDLNQEDNAKRTKLALSGDTTLNDLPVDVLKSALVTAVVAEVRGMKLAKSVWKEKADLVISRLGTDCPQWGSITVNEVFRSEIHRALDGNAAETICLKILQHSPIQSEVSQVTTVGDELFMLYDHDGQASVFIYDRNNTVDVKDVIVLPEMSPVEIAGCSASRCVYVLNKDSNSHSVWRITKDGEHQFNISPWVGDLQLPVCSISVSCAGNLVILSREPLVDDILEGRRKPIPAVVRTYDRNGSLLREMMLSREIFSSRYVCNVVERSTGNLLLMSIHRSKVMLTEMDATGRILRQCQSALLGGLDVRLVEMRGRVLLCDQNSRMELFDSELNPLDCTGHKQYEGQFTFSSNLHYNLERNEILSVCELVTDKTRVFSAFRFTEE